MNKQQLASNIWALANELRGKVPAATYKDYMLGFLFYKYLSDREEKYLFEKLDFTEEDLSDVTEDDDRLKNNCMDNLGYFIAYKNLFSTWIRIEEDFSIENVTVALSAFERYISPEYKKVFANIFSTLSVRITDLGTTDPERTKNARSIVKLVRAIPTDTREDYDVLGFIYEFLLKNFAANAGKAGEFYTPHEASVIMAEIIAYYLKDKEQISIYDPTSGSGSLLINIGSAIAKYLGDKNKIKYYAQELIPDTYNLTRMNLIMRDILPSNIVARQGDTLDKDWPYFDDGDPDSTYEFLSVDACCSNPPYSQPWEPRIDPRFDDYGYAPKSKADYAFLLHNLYHLNSDGIMTIVLPHGVLFRGGEEEAIRKKLVQKHNIETIIGLPENLFYGTGISTIIMVLRKKRVADDILFVDASKGYEKEGNKNKLRQRDIRKIVDTVTQRKVINGFSRVVSFDEIEGNDFNLNLSRYIDSGKKDDYHDIYSLMFGGIPNSEIDNGEMDKFWVAFPTLKKELFLPKEEGYSEIVNADLKSLIESNEEIISFKHEHEKRFSYLKEYLIDVFFDNTSNLHLGSLEMDIAKTIRERVQDDGLIDYYDCFEVLDNSLQAIMPDLEIVKSEGFEAARVIDEVRELKKDSKTKKLEEKVVGIDGHLIPFELVQKVFFEDEANKVEACRNRLQDLLNQKDELLDSIDEVDKAELLKDDDSGDIATKKLNAKISSIKQALKRGAEYEEDSYESIIIRVNETNTCITKAKKELKELVEKTEKDTQEKILSLTDEEIRLLLIRKWVNPLCEGIDSLSQGVVQSLEKCVLKLSEKYQTTFNELDAQIHDEELTLSDMLDLLTGDDNDMRGLKQFKTLLGGASGE